MLIAYISICISTSPGDTRLEREDDRKLPEDGEERAQGAGRGGGPQYQGVSLALEDDDIVV